MSLPLTGPPKDPAQAVAVLRRAVDAGVNHIDTAQFSGPKVANELIREALYPYPDDLVIVSKVGSVGSVRDDQGGWVPAQRPAELRAGVEENLATLGVEQLGAVNIRRMHEHGLPAEQDVPVEDQLAEMVALRDEGKIAGLGISTAPLTEVKAVSSEITCVQDPYSLLARTTAACSSTASGPASRSWRTSHSARPFPACPRSATKTEMSRYDDKAKCRVTVTFGDVAPARH